MAYNCSDCGVELEKVEYNEPEPLRMVYGDSAGTPGERSKLCEPCWRAHYKSRYGVEAPVK